MALHSSCVPTKRVVGRLGAGAAHSVGVGGAAFKPRYLGILVVWCQEPTHWKSPCCCEKLRAVGEEGVRGWDGWMASQMQWTWTWANSRRWWGAGRPGLLQSVGSQRVGHNWAAEQHLGGAVICAHPDWQAVSRAGLVSKGYSACCQGPEIVVLRTVGICEMGQFGKTTDSPRIPTWGLERAFRKICWELPPVEFELKSKKQRDMMSLSYQGDCCCCCRRCC